MTTIRIQIKKNEGIRPYHLCWTFPSYILLCDSSDNRACSLTRYILFNTPACLNSAPLILLFFSVVEHSYYTYISIHIYRLKILHECHFYIENHIHRFKLFKCFINFIPRTCQQKKRRKSQFETNYLT